MARSGRLPPRLWTAAALLLVLLLRAPSLTSLAYPDEGGLLLVARQWHDGGPALYGDLWVDRPPLLLAFWKVAALLGGVPAARVLALLWCAVLVVVAAWIGRLVGGPRGARWSALLAAVLASSPLLGASEVDAELLGAPLVLLACGAALRAAPPTSSRAQAAWALLAGVAGTSALLMKQNLADGLVFAAVLVGSAAVTRRWPRAAVLRVLALGVLGVAAVVACTLAWSVAAGHGIGDLASTLFGFRVRAAQVIAEGSTSAPQSRLVRLLAVSVASGLVLSLVVAAGPLRRGMARRQPVAFATTAMTLYGVVGIAAGGSFWQHYLLQLLPAAVLAAALTSADGRPLVATRAVVAMATGSAVLAVALAPVLFPRHHENHVVDWLAQASRPHDTALVTYGQANIIEAARLRPARYPYLWSLPVRAEDPALARLRGTLTGPHAPTWLVEWLPLDTWGLDPSGALARVIHREYRSVDVCGVPVHLRRDATRVLPPAPASC